MNFGEGSSELQSLKVSLNVPVEAPVKIVLKVPKSSYSAQYLAGR